MSLSAELEQLRKKKAELKNQLQFIEGKERALGTSLRILEERMEVQELEERVRAKRAVVERLESKRRALENRLKGPQRKSAPSPTPHRPTPLEPQKKPASMEVRVSAAPPRDKQLKPSAPAVSQPPKKPEEKKEKKEEKKKRKWF